MYCIPLDQADEIAKAGAKAFNLQRTIHRDASVPSGFVLTTEGLRVFLVGTTLLGEIEDFLKQPSDGQYSRKETFDKLCGDILRTPIPPSLEEEIESQVSRLSPNSIGLAVRSSGCLEDTERASFAGVYESFLCVSSLGDILDSIKKCWCSSWSPKAIDYSRKMGLELKVDQMAVLIQKMVPAESSGVLFTADPMTGNPWQFRVNATFGLSQDLLAAGAPTDQYVLEWDTGVILESQIAEKRRILKATPAGVEEVTLPTDAQSSNSVSGDRLQELGRLALRLDQVFDDRLDIEWAIGDNQLYVLQARPITALPEYFPHDLSEEDQQITWVLHDWHQLTDERTRLVAPLYRNIRTYEKWKRHQPDDLVLSCPAEPRELDFNWRRYRCTAWRAFRDYLPDYRSQVRWLEANEEHHRQFWERTKEEVDEEASNNHKALAGDHSLAELIPTLIATIERTEDFESRTFSAPQSMYRICAELLQEFVAEHLPGLEIENLASVTNSYTIKRANALQKLGESIVEEPVRVAFEELSVSRILPHLLDTHPDSVFVEDYRAFCWHWQFHARPVEWVGRPFPWSARLEDHHLNINAIRNTFHSRARGIREMIAQETSVRKSAEDEARAVLKGKEGSLLREFGLLLSWVQYWQPALNERGIWTRASMAAWELVWQIGVKLKDEDIVDEPEDILLFTPEQLENIANSDSVQDCRALFQKQKQEYLGNARLRAPTTLGMTRPEEVSKPTESSTHAEGQVDCSFRSGTTLVGNGMTPWQARGNALVASNIRDPGFLDQLTERDIPVCLASTLNHHEEWYTLLMTVAGLVILQDYGGGLKHVVQVAREFGVALVQLDAEPEAITSGSAIEIDGKSGTIRFLETE